MYDKIRQKIVKCENTDSVTSRDFFSLSQTVTLFLRPPPLGAWHTSWTAPQVSCDSGKVMILTAWRFRTRLDVRRWSVTVDTIVGWSWVIAYSPSVLYSSIAASHTACGILRPIAPGTVDRWNSMERMILWRTIYRVWKYEFGTTKFIFLCSICEIYLWGLVVRSVCDKDLWVVFVRGICDSDKYLWDMDGCGVVLVRWYLWWGFVNCIICEMHLWEVLVLA